jgi:hypothetical protein
VIIFPRNNEAERVGKYMIRPVLSLERLRLDEKEGQVMVRYHGFYANAHIHQPPQANVHCGQTPSAAHRLSGSLDGRRAR